MGKKICLLVFFITLALWLDFLPAQAATFTVSKSCGTATNCYPTISDAVSAAANTTVDTIEIQPGTYAESVTLTKSLTLKGVETARTIVQSANIVIAVNGLSNVTISRLTIDASSVGIQGTNAANLTISNNIFWGRSSATAIQITGTSTGNIVNNTFFQNQTAINSTIDLPITNNIFSNNTTALTATGFASFSSGNVTNNLFHNSPLGSFTYSQSDPLATNIPNNSHPNQDPKFVRPDLAPPKMDLHLQEGSGAIGMGSGGTDIGTFGGSGADTIPFPVTISSISSTTTTSTSVTLTWNANLAYNITNSSDPGSYNVYYNLTSGSTTTVNMPSPGSNATISTVITGLSNTISPPGQPSLNVPEYADSKLILSWSPVSNATGYKVHFLDSVTGIEETIDVGNSVFYILTGLVNERDYGVTVSAYSEANYHFRVTALDNTGGPYQPGIQHESAYSEEETVKVGSAVDGLRSSPTRTAFPEPIVASPNLPNSGCFIATAAYGYYSAPQVQVLREFRDGYLVTNSPGRAFVDWYYRYGPAGADFINNHAWLKPAVRIALLPAVGGAMFMVHTTLPAKIVVFGLFGIFSVYLIRRITARRGGAR